MHRTEVNGKICKTVNKVSTKNFRYQCVCVQDMHVVTASGYLLLYRLDSLLEMSVRASDLCFFLI